VSVLLEAQLRLLLISPLEYKDLFLDFLKPTVDNLKTFTGSLHISYKHQCDTVAKETYLVYNANISGPFPHPL
jgi:hypothetical protein